MQLTNTEQFNTARDRVSVARQFEMDMRRARTAQHAGLIVRQMVDRVEPELLPFALPCLSRNRIRYIKRHVRQAIRLDLDLGRQPAVDDVLQQAGLSIGRGRRGVAVSKQELLEVVTTAIARRLYKAPASVAPFPTEQIPAALAELAVARAELALLEEVER